MTNTSTHNNHTNLATGLQFGFASESAAACCRDPYTKLVTDLSTSVCISSSESLRQRTVRTQLQSLQDDACCIALQVTIVTKLQGCSSIQPSSRLPLNSTHEPCHRSLPAGLQQFCDFDLAQINLQWRTGKFSAAHKITTVTDK